jgi:ketosteroid isomerase-like protein
MLPSPTKGVDMSDETARRELDAAIRDFGEAWARGDVGALRGMLSPSYTHTDVRGRFQDRDAWLEYAHGRGGAATQITFADVTTRLIGDVAVITGRNDMSGGNIVLGDERSSLSLRFTQIWIRRDGRWLREAFQATFIDPLAPPLSQRSPS